MTLTKPKPATSKPKIQKLLLPCLLTADSDACGFKYSISIGLAYSLKYNYGVEVIRTKFPKRLGTTWICLYRVLGADQQPSPNEVVRTAPRKNIKMIRTGSEHV